MKRTPKSLLAPALAAGLAVSLPVQGQDHAQPAAQRSADE